MSVSPVVKNSSISHLPYFPLGLVMMPHMGSTIPSFPILFVLCQRHAISFAFSFWEATLLTGAEELELTGRRRCAGSNPPRRLAGQLGGGWQVNGSGPRPEAHDGATLVFVMGQ